MAEKVRTLTKVVDLGKLHLEFKALAPSFAGLTASDGQIGDELRLINADDLSDAVVDATIAAHVPRTPNQLKDAEADSTLDSKIWKATIIFIMKRLNELRTQPGQTFPALSGQDVRDGIRQEYRNL